MITKQGSGAGGATQEVENPLILQSLFCAASYNIARKGFFPPQGGLSPSCNHPAGGWKKKSRDPPDRGETFGDPMRGQTLPTITLRGGAGGATLQMDKFLILWGSFCPTSYNRERFLSLSQGDVLTPPFTTPSEWMERKPRSPRIVLSPPEPPNPSLSFHPERSEGSGRPHPSSGSLHRCLFRQHHAPGRPYSLGSVNHSSHTPLFL